MIAITDEGVTVFALPSFALKGQAFRTRGAAALCWHHSWLLLAVAKPGGIGKAHQCVTAPEYNVLHAFAAWGRVPECVHVEPPCIETRNTR